VKVLETVIEAIEAGMRQRGMEPPALAAASERLRGE
jgi:hypothetical protein